MANAVSNNVANTALRLGLLTASQVAEAFEELGSRNVPDDQFLRLLERKGLLTPYQTGKLLKGDTEGFVLGGYRILYKIASGSFGRVYRADDPASGRVLAIKVLRQRWTEKKDKLDLFLREAKLGMSLRHPNIVEILSVNHEPKTNQHFIVMEFVEGGNLRDLLAIRKRLQAADVLRILQDTASALAHAFSHGITHRDMKLTNILLSAAGPAKLVDFGLAGGGGAQGEDKEEVTVDRTVDYAGLEKATNAPDGDPRSDLFFLGCVGFELLSGHSPLEQARSRSASVSARRFEKIPRLKPAEVQVPRPLLALIESLMVLDPDRRVQTPSQLLDHIREMWEEIVGDPHEAQVAGPAVKKPNATIFLVESDETLQDLLRTKLKEKGYRMLIAADPVRALERFRQQPYELLIVNASTTGETGYYVFEQVMDEARRQELACRGIIILEPDQTDWKDRIDTFTNCRTLVQPVKYKQLSRTIQDLLEYDGES